MFQSLGRYLVILGASLVCLGGILYVGGKLPWFGKLPGDIVMRKGNMVFYFPLATCIILSMLVSLLYHIFSKK